MSWRVLSGVTGFVSSLEHGSDGLAKVWLLRSAAALGLPVAELLDVGAPVADRVEGLPS